MNVEINSKYYTIQQLLDGEVSLQLIGEIGEYLQCDLLDVPEILIREYLAVEIDSDVIVVKEEGKIVAAAVVYVDYRHVHTGRRTLVTDAMFGIKSCKVAKIKLLKTLYAHAQMHQCSHIATTQFVGKKGNSLRFMASIRDITEG